MGERRVSAALCVSLLSLCMPTLLERIPHTSLCTHAVILLAIGLHLRAVRSPSPALAAAALLLLAATALVLLAWRRPVLSWQRYAGLAAAAAMAVFALSNRVYAGHTLLLSYGPVPHWLASFRGTGRFFWPASYLIMLGSVAAILRMLELRKAASLLLAALLLQILDTSGLRDGVRLHGQAYGAPWLIDTAALGPVLARNELLTIWPTFGCGALISENEWFMQLVQLGSRSAIRVNTMYTARDTTPVQCSETATLGQP